MSLQGTLDTFTLDEVAELVERTQKTGALSARDGRFTGTVWFAAGGLCAAEAGADSGPCESTEDLQVRLVDVCFELFALRQGYFEFVPGEQAPWDTGDVVSLAEVAERVAAVAGDEWDAVVASVPSFDHRPVLAGDLESESVTLTLDRLSWRLMAQMDGDRDVRAIGRNLGVSALEVARTLHRLVDAGAVQVLPPEEGTVVPLAGPAKPAGREPVVGYQPPEAASIVDVEELALAREALERAALGLDEDSGDGSRAVERGAESAADAEGDAPYYDDAGRLLDAALVGGDTEVDVRRYGHGTVGGALEDAYAGAAESLEASIVIEADPDDREEEEEVGATAESAGDRASLLRMFSSLNNKR